MPEFCVYFCKCCLVSTYKAKDHGFLIYHIYVISLSNHCYVVSIKEALLVDHRCAKLTFHIKLLNHNQYPMIYKTIQLRKLWQWESNLIKFPQVICNTVNTQMQILLIPRASSPPFSNNCHLHHIFGTPTFKTCFTFIHFECGLNLHGMLLKTGVSGSEYYSFGDWVIPWPPWLLIFLI